MPFGSRTPYRGIRYQNQCHPRVPANQVAPGMGRGGLSKAARKPLLTVTHQDLIAGRGQFGAIFLKAGQNGQVGFIHDGTTVFLDIPRARLLLLRRSAMLLLLGHGSAGNGQRQQSDYQRKFTHRVPFILTAVDSDPNSTWHQRGRLFRLRRPPIAAPKGACKCGQICGDRPLKLRALEGRFRGAGNRLASHIILLDRCA